MNSIEFTARLKQTALSVGFELSGACPAVAPRGMASLADWLKAGYAGNMTYLADRRAAYEHPRHILSGARGLLMLGKPYSSAMASDEKAGHGRIARYAAGPVDYHDDIRKRLKTLGRFAKELQPGVRVRGVVDTAPLLERDFAQLAGLGWIGKNTMLLNRRLGSYFFLAALVLDRELAYDSAPQSGYCGRCSACLDACPTNAFPRPYVLDATRCISYLTIEWQGPIPRELRPAIGNRLFGCDVCQEVCPWNRRAAKTMEPSRAGSFPSSLSQPLHALFKLSDETFREQFRHTVFWRVRRRGLLRNAAIVLGNQGVAESHDALARAQRDPEPVVRGAAAWALGRIGTVAALETLRDQLDVETDPTVRDEVEQALRENVRREP
ncbi:MAG: tRNA epoxyqueuosine(34) reductase QueG [Planctomycetota bacterium]